MEHVRSTTFVLNTLREERRTRIKPYGTFNTNKRLLQRLPIQNHMKLPLLRKEDLQQITFSIIMFAKKSSMSNLVKSFWNIMYYTSSSIINVKSYKNSLNYNYQKICSRVRRPESLTGSEKKTTFSKRSRIQLLTGFSNILIPETRFTGR